MDEMSHSFTTSQKKLPAVLGLNFMGIELHESDRLLLITGLRIKHELNIVPHLIQR